MTAPAGLVPGLALSLIAGTAAAQAALVPPDCTAYLTVQNTDCVVEHHYLCPSIGGPRLRVDFDQDGPFYMAGTDDEGRWLWSQSLPDGAVSRFIEDGADPVSLSQLLDTGENRYVFSEIRDGETLRISGYDRLTGEHVAIDGEPLLATEYAFQVTAPDGQVRTTIEGAEYVSARHRRFFSGIRRFTDAEGQQVTRDSTPVEFVYPGEPGFMSETPTRGCSALMSALPQPQPGGPA